MVFNGRNDAINFIESYGSMFPEAKKRAAEIQTEQTEGDGTGLKILTPKQMLQRLPIVLAQVKAGKSLKRYILYQYTSKILYPFLYFD